MLDLRSEPEIEVLSAADAARRRHWRDADKIRIVQESFAGHRQASAAAQRQRAAAAGLYPASRDLVVAEWTKRGRQAKCANHGVVHS